jgi:hypothetical protein
MTGARTKTWFDMLRRDGKLFALVAALLLVLGTFPATHVSAEAGPVICTVEGPAADGTPGAPADPACPVCIVSASCLGGLAAPDQQAMPGILSALPAERLMPPRRAGPVGDKAGPGLASIRAPPTA